MDDFDKELDEKLNNMKASLQEEKISNDFKNDLLKKMHDKSKNSNQKTSSFRKLAIAASFFVVIIAGYGIANDFDMPLLKNFSNIDKTAKKAIEEGNVEYLNNDYVTNNGVSIKAEYIIKNNNDIYIALKVKTKDEYDKILISEYEILDENGEVKYNNLDSQKASTSTVYYRNSDDKEIYIKISGNQNDSNMLLIKGINIVKNRKKEKVDGNWKIELK